ncbi:MAG: glycosyltransferase family 4 protein [Proteobacteria bacterium]|nr:glycosyltransferase family 4 protein [Pseudomonadota bacterium]MBU1582919.1 glycosyltransferase family 4 protein [Pseudomonadota bacterium]MBU2455616.1 glycosyltransferase family 4 protein [Pseudomonadota bacterium]MBU2627339.1 glycosyltransferase family 4 protein [Pseudomonadota bacterium]
MNLFVTGTRGIPDIPGGIETHCQELYPLIAEKGYKITISGRKNYLKSNRREWKGLKILPVWTLPNLYAEAIVHTFFSILKAKSLKADLLHIHAIGPAILIPFAKCLGLKVVFTSHGQDYKKKKWGIWAKLILSCGEYLGGRFSDNVIAISDSIHDILLKRCKRKAYIIYNGVSLPEPSTNTEFLDRIGVTPDRYVLAVSRFVPEKGLDLLIKALQLGYTPYKLVIAGDADHETNYSKNLKQMIDADDRIMRTGYITGEPLNQLYSHAGLFVLPSFHEGLPIALLEAMSYGLSVLVSDIEANLEVGLAKERYFNCGDITDLKEKIDYHLANPISPDEKSIFRSRIEERYNWTKIADQTIKVYEETLAR